MADQRDDEIDGNFAAFQEMLPFALRDHRGQYALMRHREIEGCFSTLRAALDAGMQRFADQLFSIQEVTDRPADLGLFSHANNTRLA